MSFRKFKSLHYAVNIKEFILKEINRLEILDKIVSITTDNEASVVSACKDLNANKILRISCFCHNLNLVVGKMGLWKK